VPLHLLIAAIAAPLLVAADIVPIDPTQVTIVGLLLAIGAAGLKRLWVFGWTYSEAAADRDFWRDTALKAMGHTDAALAVATKASK